MSKDAKTVHSSLFAVHSGDAVASPKISVVVPVYKVEKYLRECVESVLAQTFADFELILVDDGSPDNSGAICDEFAARDSRVRVFHKENGGVSSARNLGVAHARGEWISFVDSDDRIAPDYLSDLAKVAFSKFAPDVVVCGLSMVDTSGNVSKTVAFQPAEIIPSELGNVPEKWAFLPHVCVWGHFFKRSIIEKNALKFDTSISLGEDQLFYLSYLQSVSRVAVSPSTGYLYLWEAGRGSLTTSKKRPREILRVASGNELLAENLIKKWNIPKCVAREWAHVVVWGHYNSALRGLYESANADDLREAFRLLKYLYGFRGHFRARKSAPKSFFGNVIKWSLLIAPTFAADFAFRLKNKIFFKK